MKIPNKHATACTDLVLIFLEDGHCPVDELELGIIRKVLGFGQYCGMVKIDTSGCIGSKYIGKLKKIARLNLTEDESSAILDMFSEVEYRGVSMVDFFTETAEYLLGDFNE